MRQIRNLLGCGLLLSLGVTGASAASAAEPTLDEVVARNVQARGGKAAWDALKSLKVTGTYRAFSKVHPFTLYRKNDNRYFMDTIMDDKVVTTGHDGTTLWWDNHWLQLGAQEIRGADLQVAQRDVEFTPALMDHAKKGYSLKLLGPVELEGLEAIGVELTRADDSVETWYLDPQTYLELGRVSPGSDFGQPMEQRTFYDDYRTVGGVLIPYYTESQWYTRNRVMQIEQIEANLDIDDDVFRMPLPTGMGPLRTLAGTFKVAAALRQQPGAPWQESTFDSTVEALLRGGLLQERFTDADGGSVVRNITYDQFHKRYRVTQIQDNNTQLDVLEGDFDDAGKLVTSNVSTGTTWTGFGMTFHNRVSISEITEDGFKVEQEISTDGGQNWFLAFKSTYSRAEP